MLALRWHWTEPSKLQKCNIPHFIEIMLSIIKCKGEHWRWLWLAKVYSSEADDVLMPQLP